MIGRLIDLVATIRSGPSTDRAFGYVERALDELDAVAVRIERDRLNNLKTQQVLVERLSALEVAEVELDHAAEFTDGWAHKVRSILA